MSYNQSYYIETFGCQMNDRDSEIMAQLLSENYLPAHDIEQSDVVVVNTCSIREKAQQKAFSLLGRLKILKKKNKDMVIAVVGCVAQQEGEKLLSRMPYIDLVMGTQSIYNLPALLEDISLEHKRVVAVEQTSSFVIPPFLPNLSDGPPHKRFVTIMQGCNNFCTYCVVPYTRGREVSRKFSEIIEESTHLVENGIKEITLLGQNVNSYGRDMDGQQVHTFSELLHAVANIKGLERLRFTTSNPRDLTHELIACFDEIDILCSHFHLPVQSGSDSILSQMNRKYSIEKYMELVAELRVKRPDIAITTDIIVGFPGESESDFMDTMNLVNNVRYHGAFSFKYSDRPQAKSINFDNKLSEKLKGERLALLQKRINEIVLERNNEFLGKIDKVMVEGKSRSHADQWSGRVGTNHIVNFTGASNLQVGDIVDVHIDEACLHSLRGKLHFTL